MAGFSVSPPLIRLPCVPRNFGHVREVGFCEREKYINFIVAAPKFLATFGRVAPVESGH